VSDLASSETTIAKAQNLSPSAVKQCCAAVYGSDAARMLLGDSFHPGGAELTNRLGQILNLTSRTRLLDVAAGRGASAIFLAERFGCEVVGIDYSRENVSAGNEEARAKRLSGKVTFQWADAEKLPFLDGSFDAVICECGFCTFPDKHGAAREFNRVLPAGGRVGLSDLTREGSFGPQLDGLTSWIACIADAQPLSAYTALLSGAAFTVSAMERHDGALAEFVNQLRTRLLAAEVMVKLQKLALPWFDFEAAKTIAIHALEAIKEGKLGYAIVVASKTP
jgi:arsenite methyltransferase